MCGNAKLQNRAFESHDRLAMQSVPKSLLGCLSHMPKPRKAVRLEAVRLNGIRSLGIGD
jgi:hypothetical protein